MQDYATIQREKAQKLVRARLEVNPKGFRAFQPWKRIAKELEMADKEVNQLRKSDEFLQAVTRVTQGKCNVFYDLEQKVNYTIVRDWLNAAFGSDFTRKNAKAIWSQCKRRLI